MERVPMLEPRSVSLNDLFTNGKIYRVPPFQRDYSWEVEQWEDLWLDIAELEKTPLQHYMGAIVLQVGGNGLIVIDGQQRIATLSILALAVLKHIRRLIENGVEAVPNEERYHLLFKQYLGTKDPASLRSSSRLFLNERDDSFYQHTLLQFREPLNRRKLTDSESRLWAAFEYFVAQIGRHFAGRLDGGTLAGFLNALVAQRLTFIQITVEDDLSAYTVFETLNARGLELTATDLLKNYLFSKIASSRTDMEHVREQWQRISGVVGLDELPLFLRHFLNSRRRYVRRERLFKVVKEDVKTPEQVFSLLDDLERAANWYRALGDPSDELWSDYTGCKELVRELCLFKVTQFRPLVLACFAKSWSPADLQDVLKACVVVSFRFNMIGRRNPRELEQTYNEVAVSVSNGETNHPSQLKAGLRAVYVPDEEFRNDFAQIPIATDSKRKFVAYVLCRLESHLTTIAHDFESTPATVEHILPENPGPGWEASFNEEDRTRFTFRLGNYTLLERNLNKEVGNRTFPEKQSFYAKSQFKITRDIVQTDWTPTAIGKRQAEMAKWATSVWRLD